MKKITCSIIALSLSALSATAFACPKGTTLQGGEGPHHKGGKCVVATGATAKKTEDKKAKVEKKVESTKEKVATKDKVEKPKT
ncbi:hypothetical protein [Acinetobacter boissieri]|uniref:Uncharacterized protein n=1 Tax=Acinetobacter boissieri TaxID=1219383 RepID=A0A1G6GZE2_9GAMM|nr:hypothetical protein [Acinetobacter boissieri]SDB87417.1 hypothetical protein SAMN05421733_10375 [Acinetobacter boissieri]